MKKPIAEKTRRIIIGVLPVLILCALAAGIYYFVQPSQKQEEQPVYSCKQVAAVDYRVFFEKNSFFPGEESAGPGRAYLTPLTDYVETVLNYSFSGGEDGSVAGEYRVEAILTGYLLREKPGLERMEREKAKVWEKAEELLPATPFGSDDGEVQIQQGVDVDVIKYIDFADRLRDELKYSADSVELSIIYHISVRVSTPEGEISEELRPYLLIPVKGNAFYVDGMRTDNRDSVINQSRTVAVEGMAAKRAGCGLSAIVLFALWIGFIYKTVPVKPDPVEYEAARIIKKYGDRMAFSQSGVEGMLPEKVLAMHDFDDLVKISDDRGLPILYDAEAGHSYYVLDNNLAYKYTARLHGAAESGRGDTVQA